MRLIVLGSIVSSLLFYACSKGDKRETTTPSDSMTTELDYSATYALESYLAPDNIASSEAQTIDSTCAMVVYPTEEQFRQMEEESGDGFETMVDDGNFYQSQALGLLDSLGVKTVTVKSRYIRIPGLSLTLDVRKKNLPAWNLILYNVHKQPIVVSSATLTLEDIAAYFEIGS
jgi:hypothetical protein